MCCGDQLNRLPYSDRLAAAQYVAKGQPVLSQTARLSRDSANAAAGTSHDPGWQPRFAGVFSFARRWCWFSDRREEGPMRGYDVRLEISKGTSFFSNPRCAGNGK